MLSKIGIDVMGSDSLPIVLFRAVIRAAQDLSGKAEIVVFSEKSHLSNLKQELQESQSDHLPIQIISCDDTIEMYDEPLRAVRDKKGSSMIQGVATLKDKEIDAFISAGNTGALIAASKFNLPKLPRIRRPVLIATLPKTQGSVAVADVGGNLSCKSDHLVEFALMAAAYKACISHSTHIRIGLLNIGTEETKGTPLLKETKRRLGELNLMKNEGVTFEFLGNFEARDIFAEKIDVLVTDGFSGNIFLKTAEGMADFIFNKLKEVYQESGELRTYQDFQKLQSTFDYEEYLGAFVGGTDGLVIKCHGQSTTKAIYHSILGASNLVKEQFMDRYKKQLLQLSEFMQPAT